MPISQKQYQIMTKKASPGSKSWIDIPSAFVIGGLICTVGEYLLNTFKDNGFDTKTAGAWTSVTLVFLSALLTGLGLYEKIAKHGGSGTLVPITGFANGVASPAVEAAPEGEIFGKGVQIFTIAGPVILYGVFASWLFGLIYWLMHLI